MGDSITRTTLLVASAAVLAPFAVSVVLFTASRWPDRSFSAASDYATLGISIVIASDIHRLLLAVSSLSSNKLLNDRY